MKLHVMVPDAFKESIERAVPQARFHYVRHYGPLNGLAVWPMFYLWQFRVFLLARRLHERERFDLCHHLNYFTWRVPSFLWALNIPFVCGPLGGAQPCLSGSGKTLGFAD